MVRTVDATEIGILSFVLLTMYHLSYVNIEKYFESNCIKTYLLSCELDMWSMILVQCRANNQYMLACLSTCTQHLQFFVLT